jgi:PadR family transcriptional regulator PadR
MEVISGGLEASQSQMRKGVLELCVLLSLSAGPAYTTDILGTLKSHGMLVVEGTLYSFLSRLRADDMLAYEWRESDAGPPRKYYHLTKAGTKSLEELLETWHSMSRSMNSLIKQHLK